MLKYVAVEGSFSCSVLVLLFFAFGVEIAPSGDEKDAKTMEG